MKKVAGVMKVLVKNRNLNIEAAMGLHEEVLVPTIMHGCEILVWYKYEKSRIRAVEMDHLSS